MNRDKIIELARECYVVPYIVRTNDTEHFGRIEDFFKAAFAAGVAAEQGGRHEI